MRKIFLTVALCSSLFAAEPPSFDRYAALNQLMAMPPSSIEQKLQEFSREDLSSVNLVSLNSFNKLERSLAGLVRQKEKIEISLSIRKIQEIPSGLTTLQGLISIFDKSVVDWTQKYVSVFYEQNNIKSKPTEQEATNLKDLMTHYIYDRIDENTLLNNVKAIYRLQNPIIDFGMMNSLKNHRNLMNVGTSNLANILKHNQEIEDLKKELSIVEQKLSQEESKEEFVKLKLIRQLITKLMKK